MKDHIETLCVQAGYQPKTGESRIPPIVQSTTFFYGDSQVMADLFDLKREGFFYSRLANPTVDALEKKIAALEGGAAGIGCASGMSALLLTAMTLCEEGDNIVTAGEIYGGTYNLFSTTLPKFGIKARFFDVDAPAEEIDALIDEKTKFVFAETIANPAVAACVSWTERMRSALSTLKRKARMPLRWRARRSEQTHRFPIALQYLLCRRARVLSSLPTGRLKQNARR